MTNPPRFAPRWDRRSKTPLVVLIAAVIAGLALPVLPRVLTFLPEAGIGAVVAFTLLATLALAMIAIRLTKYDLIAPAPLFGITWLAALTIAQLPFLPGTSWSTDMWLAVTIPPASLVIAAVLASGGTAIDRPNFVLPAGTTRSFLAIVAMFVVVGGTTTLYEFMQRGQIPLLSGAIDQERTQLVVNPFLHLLTRPLPIAIMLVLIGSIRAGIAPRVYFAVVMVVAGALIAGQGGRLHLFLPVFAAAIVLLASYGATPRFIMVALGASAFGTALLAGLFFYRIDQHPDLPFERLLYSAVLSTRPEALGWTVPIQLGTAGGYYVLSNLIDTHALEDSGPGWYSLHGMKRYVPSKDSQAVAQTVTGALITSTYISDLYGDFGLAGAVVGSAVIGVLYGLLYRWAVIARSITLLMVYGYATFWLAFFIYFDVWTYEIFWAADIPLLIAGTKVMLGRHSPTIEHRAW